MTKKLSDLRVVGTSLTVSTLDVTVNLFISLITGSTVVLAQALQGLSDLITGILLLLGVQRSKKAADNRYQFGYGREIFFWVLMAGLLMFLGTGGLSIYFGYQQLMNPRDIQTAWLAVAALAFGFGTNLYAFSLSVRRLRQSSGASSSWWQLLRHSSIVETKATLLIDFLGTVATLLGLVALLAFVASGDARLDGLGSIAIGLAMMVASLYLIRDVRDLIVGRSVDSHVADRITAAAESVQGVNAVLDLRTMYLGSGKLLVIVEIHIKDGYDTDRIEQVTDAVKQIVSRDVPEAHHIQVEVETPD